MRDPRLSLEILDDLDPLASEWDELVERLRERPFLRPGWTRAWRDAFGRGRLVLLAVRRDGRLVGVLPLERRLGALRSPTNAHTPEFGPVAADEGATAALATGVFSLGVRAVVLERVEPGPTLEAFREAAEIAGYRVLRRRTVRLSYIAGGESLGAHEWGVSRNLRHDVARRTRRLTEVGAVSIQVCREAEDLERLLEEAFRVEQLGWKGARGSAITSRPETRRFYSDVARWAARSGLLRLAFLRLDDRPIAFQLDLETDERYYSLKIGYDPVFERFSPGKLLAYSMVSRALSHGAESYELLGRDEPWKLRWTGLFRERVDLHAFASSLSGRLTWSASGPGRSIARRLPFASRAAAALRR